MPTKKARKTRESNNTDKEEIILHSQIEADKLRGANEMVRTRGANKRCEQRGANKEVPMNEKRHSSYLFILIKRFFILVKVNKNLVQMSHIEKASLKHALHE